MVFSVAAVADGLKAWEMLKGNPQSVDLILTEVDLPSISGYALLTLIMEHDICKNIPLISMLYFYIYLLLFFFSCFQLLNLLLFSFFQ